MRLLFPLLQLLPLFLALLLALPAHAWGDGGLGFSQKPAPISGPYVISAPDSRLPNATVFDPSGTGDLTSFDMSVPSFFTVTGVPDLTGAVSVSVSYATGLTANRALITDSSGNAGLGQIDLSTSIVTGSLPQANVASLVTDLGNKQGLDATLTALAGLDSTAGFVTVTGADTFVRRSFASSGSSITITNPAGTAGDVNLEVGNHSAALLTSGTVDNARLDTQLSEIANLSVSAGDIFVVNDSGAIVRLAGGSDTNVLTYDSSQNPNVKWAAAAGGGVTSIGVNAPSTIFTSSADITTSGDVTLSYATGQTADRIFGTDASGNVGLMAMTANQLVAHSAAKITSGTLDVARGGTGVDGSAATDGQILIGHDANNNFSLASLTAGANVTITPGAGSITIAASGGSGTALPATTMATARILKSATIAQTTSTAYTALGMTAPSLAGTVSAALDSNGQYLSCASAASDNSQAGYETGLSACQFRQKPIWWTHVKTGSSITNIEIYCGFTDNLGELSSSPATPAANCAMFRYVPASDGTAFWRTIMNDGGVDGGTITATSQSIATSTDYLLCIDATDVNAIKFYINGSLVDTRDSTNAPSTTAALALYCKGQNTSGSARTFQVGGVQLELMQ